MFFFRGGWAGVTNEAEWKKVEKIYLFFLLAENSSISKWWIEWIDKFMNEQTKQLHTQVVDDDDKEKKKEKQIE